MKLKNRIRLLLFGKGAYDNYTLLIVTLFLTCNYLIYVQLLNFFIVF